MRNASSSSTTVDQPHQTSSAGKSKNLVNQTFDSFLVMDFEATCQENGKIQPIQEVIEFPVLELDAKTFREKARFHHYVRPTERPILTSFCTNLTGIVQETVDRGKVLSEVLPAFHEWLFMRGLLKNDDAEIHSSWTFVTCGDWDLGTQLPQEAAFRQIELPSYFGRWINLKKAFGEAKGYFPNSLSVMLRDLQIPPTGRLHSGIDDVRNMCAIVEALGNGGYVFRNTSAHITGSRFIRLPKFGARRKRRPFNENE